MPNAPKTPHHQIRVDRDLWDEFGTAAVAMGTDRSEYLREFMRWAVRREGAKQPKRPASAAPEAEPAAE
jgi:hypothetical protein